MLHRMAITVCECYCVIFLTHPFSSALQQRDPSGVFFLLRIKWPYISILHMKQGVPSASYSNGRVVVE